MATLRARDGTELTDELIEALADEAERGYDLSKARRVYVGRSPSPAPRLLVRLHVRVDHKLAKALKARARLEKRSVSDIARTALTEYVSRPS